MTPQIEPWAVERRRAPRVPWDAPLLVEELPPPVASRPRPLLAEDVSECGVRASSPEFVPLGARLLIAFDDESTVEPLRTVGAVVWVKKVPYQERWTLGIAFVDMPEEALRRLRRVVSGR
jgi:hypothetical protein